jgi:hypothetical protein
MTLSARPCKVWWKLFLHIASRAAPFWRCDDGDRGSSPTKRGVEWGRVQRSSSRRTLQPHHPPYVLRRQCLRVL